MKEKIAIWGTGSLAKKFYSLYCEKFEVVCFFDNKTNICSEGGLYNLPVLKWTSDNSYKIVIASSYWKEIAQQLNGYGLLPFKDYILWKHATDCEHISYSEIYELVKISGIKEYGLYFSDKKIAVVYGNCQTVIIENLLQLNGNFARDYIVVKIPKVCEYNDNRGIIEHLVEDEAFLKQIDLFIYQPVAENNKFSPILCTDRIMCKLKQTCKKIAILNLYFTGYFPQMTLEGLKLLRDIHQSGLFPFGDKYVDIFLEKGMSPEEIIDTVLDEDFIEPKVIIENAKESLCELQRRECQTDIKITDYIIEHYSKEQMFYSRNHPNEELLLEFTNRLLAFLGYGDIKISMVDFLINCGSLKGQDVPIYPCVVKAFGMDRYEKKYYPNRYLYKEVMLDIKEFLKLYIESKIREKMIDPNQ